MEATGGDVANTARLERDDIVHRKNAALLSDDEVGGLRSAFAQIKQISADARGDDRGFFEFAGMHGVPYWDCPHHTPNRIFLPWHRAYLYRLEQALADRVAGVTLPWWDWTTTRGDPGAVRRGGGRRRAQPAVQRRRRSSRRPTSATARRWSRRRPATPGPPEFLPGATRLARGHGPAELRGVQRRLRGHPRRRPRLGRRDDGQRRLRRVRPGLLGAPHDDRPDVVAVAAAGPDERRPLARLGADRPRAVQPHRRRRAERQRARLRLRRLRDARRAPDGRRQARRDHRVRAHPVGGRRARSRISATRTSRSAGSSTPAARTRGWSTSTTPMPTRTRARTRRPATPDRSTSSATAAASAPRATATTARTSGGASTTGRWRARSA